MDDNIRASSHSAISELLNYSCALLFTVKGTEMVGGHSFSFKNEPSYTFFLYNARFQMAFTICKSSASLPLSILSYVSVVKVLSTDLLVLFLFLIVDLPFVSRCPGFLSFFSIATAHVLYGVFLISCVYGGSYRLWVLMIELLYNKNVWIS